MGVHRVFWKSFKKDCKFQQGFSLLDAGLVERLKFAQQIRVDHHPLFADLNKEAISEIKLRLCSDLCWNVTHSVINQSHLTHYIISNSWFHGLFDSFDKQRLKYTLMHSWTGILEKYFEHFHKKILWNIFGGLEQKKMHVSRDEIINTVCIICMHKTI